MMPKVSVIFGCYNQKDYVRQAIESALNQTYPNLEVIATDNGSTDGTQEILKEYANNPRVRLILRKENAPLTTLTNEAISLARGEFVSFLSGDDYYLPEKTQCQMESFAGLPADYGVVYSGGYRLNAITGEMWLDRTLKDSGYVLEDMLRKYNTVGFVIPISPVMRKECFLRYPYHEDMFSEGEAVLLRIALTYKFKYLDKPLVVMRDHLSNMGKAIKLNSREFIAAMEKFEREPDLPDRLRPALDLFRARIFRNYGWQGVRVAEDPQWARECFRLALGWHAWQIFHPKTPVGFCLSMLPKPVLHVFNAAANRVRRKKANVVFKESYT